MNHAMLHIQEQQKNLSKEEQQAPVMVIDFIKKWVAKEKVLMNQIVQTHVVPELTEQSESTQHIIEGAAAHPSGDGGSMYARKNKSKFLVAQGGGANST